MHKLHNFNFKFKFFYLKGVIFSIILLPSLEVVPGLPALRVDDILLLLWPVLLLRYNSAFSGVKSGRFWVLCCFFFLFSVSTLNGILNGYAGSFGDFNQLIRFVKYISMYLLAYTVLNDADNDDLCNLFKFISLCGVFLFIIVVFQYFNILGLNKFYVQLVAPTQYDTLVREYMHPRPVGMIGNPNELGYLFVLLFFAALFLLQNFKVKMGFLHTIVFFLGIIFTMSRGSFLALCAGFLAFICVYLLHKGLLKNIKTAISFLIFIFLLSAFALHPSIYDAFTWRIVKIFELSSDSSFQVRLSNWSENIAIIKEHPILGVGPLRRAEFLHAADNEWLLVWRSYGAVGVVLVVTSFLFSLFRRKSAQVKSLEFALIASAFIYMIPTAVFHSLALFPFVLFLLAFVDTQKRTKDCMQ